MQGASSALLGHRCRAALEMRHVGTGVPASSPEGHTGPGKPWTVLPIRRSLPHHPATFSVTIRLPLHASSQSHLQSAPSSARPGRGMHSLSGHRGASAAWAWMRPDKAYATGSCEVPAAKRICAQWGINTHSRPYHPALEDTTSDAQTAEVRLDSKPPRTLTVQSHKAQGAPPGARALRLSGSPGEGVGWGRGAGVPDASWEVLNLLLTQPWGLSGRVLPKLRYVLEGCLVGPPQGSGGGAHSGLSPRPRSPAHLAQDGA